MAKRGRPKKSSIKTKYIVIYGDPQAYIYNTMKEAEDEAVHLVNECGMNAEQVFIFETSKAWQAKSTNVTIEKIAISEASF